MSIIGNSIAIENVICNTIDNSINIDKVVCNGVVVFEKKNYLYSGTANEAGFVAYKCGIDGYAGTADGTEVYAILPTVSIGANMRVSVSSSNGGAYVGSVISNAINITNYNTLKFSYYGSCGEVANYNIIKVGIVTTKKQGNLENYVKKKLILMDSNCPTLTVSGTGTIDVSGITGNVYIVIHVMCNTKAAPCFVDIANMYLE